MPVVLVLTDDEAKDLDIICMAAGHLLSQATLSPKRYDELATLALRLGAACLGMDEHDFAVHRIDAETRAVSRIPQAPGA